MILFFLLLAMSLNIQTHEADSQTRFIARHYDHPYAKTQARVRNNTKLGADEEAYLRARQPITKKALESLLQMPLADHEVPRIAFCHSGGGYRALIASLGTLKAADTITATRSTRDVWSLLNSALHSIAHALHLVPTTNTTADVANQTVTSGKGLLDAVTYNASLSGSTWAVAGWIDSGLDLQNYLAHIATHLNQHILVDPDLTDLASTLLEKQYYKQPVSLVDCYGALIAQKILVHDSPSSIPLMSRHAYIDNGAMPFPIYTAIIGDEGAYEHSWVEFTPYEVGSTDLRSFIPTWAFGRTFTAGTSRDMAAPQKLSYGLGIWGSGMSITVEEFFTTMIAPTLKRSLLDYRISPARVANWTLNLKNCPLNTQKELTLVDAGIDFNVPLPPLLRPERNVDIIIVCDASSSEIGHELRQAETWAYQNHYPFPPINYNTLSRASSVHRHPTNAQAPIIIYMPLVKNSRYQNGWDPFATDFTSTFDFSYTQEQVVQLSGLSAFNMLASQEIILDTIREWIMQEKNKGH